LLKIIELKKKASLTLKRNTCSLGFVLTPAFKLQRTEA